ncbi:MULTISPECIES: DUF4410 domain-containing protein [unclassified Luteimonas]
MTPEAKSAVATVVKEVASARHIGSSTHRRVIVGLVLAVTAVICVGCAGARVQNVQRDHALILPRPARVVVYDFTTGPTDVQLLTSPRQEGEPALSLSQEQPDLLAEAVADSLATRTVEAIQSLGLPAERVAGAGLPEVNDLVIEGDFVRVDAGSRALRFVVGFGLGASEVRTQVRVFQVTEEGWKPVKQFETVATGSRLPGAVVAPALGGSAVLSSAVGAGELRTTVNADTRRTAEQIMGKVSELKAAQGW